MRTCRLLALAAVLAGVMTGTAFSAETVRYSAMTAVFNAEWGRPCPWMKWRRN